MGDAGGSEGPCRLCIRTRGAREQLGSWGSRTVRERQAGVRRRRGKEGYRFTEPKEGGKSARSRHSKCKPRRKLVIAFRSLVPPSEGPVSRVRLCDCGLTTWCGNRGRSPSEHISSASRFHFLNPVPSTKEQPLAMKGEAG